jgi:cyclopropane fatty-acyl-phospholipid synthase-like methyltransferase
METPQTAPPQPNPFQQLLGVASGYILSCSLWVAAELDVASHLGSGPKSATELAKLTQTNPDILARVLRCLAMTGIFAEPSPGTFGLTPAAELLRKDAPQSQRDSVIWLSDPFHHRMFGDLLHSVKTGQPAVEHATGKKAFEYFADDEVEGRRFHAAMTSFSASQIAALLEAYDFSSCKSLIDVGGGHGHLVCEVLQQYPQMKGVVFDVGSILGDTRGKIDQRGLNSRCQAVDGDFFQSVPAGFDAYLMKSIIHDWNDEKAGIILKNCRKALEGNANGKLLLVEMVRPAGNEPHFSKVLDIEMLIFPGGRERSEEEFRTLLAENGFRLSRIMPTKSPMCVIEGVAA